jgi:hypothetical protein
MENSAINKFFNKSLVREIKAPVREIKAPVREIKGHGYQWKALLPFIKAL